MTNAIVWFRRDLRLADNPALQAALDAGFAPVPVYVHAPAEDAAWPPGAASRAWLHRSLRALARSLEARGSRLLLRCGDSAAQLLRLQRETGAGALYFNRLPEPAARERDQRVLEAMRAAGVHAQAFDGNYLLPPGRVRNAAGAPYRVFTPYWRAASAQLPQARPASAPTRLPALPPTLASVEPRELGLRPRPRWDLGFWDSGWRPGEPGALEALEAFIEGAAHGYANGRDLPGRIGTSRLSPHLHFGEISPRQALAAVRAARAPRVPAADLARFEAELGWREFAAQTLIDHPDYADRDLDPGFRHFDWAAPHAANLQAWQQGRTGVPLVDAGMRELWHTGWMHNRVRMVAASFLTKNLRYHWRHGAAWFWQTLVDADLANNSQGWQWAAGTGADAAPYFRVFNPLRQAERFDPRGDYVRRWIPELGSGDYPEQPIVDLAASRDAALGAFRRRREE
jgi:deoxyribodipyrimidine photo-lyase